MDKKIVFVGMSGGVDSSVSALLLKQQGYNVVGVFIRTWHPSFIKCSEEEERLDAMRVAAHLDIPFLTFDFSKEYKKDVADYMVREYSAGRTPNPDVMCNKYVKFGAFLKKALAMGADYVATGHYSRVHDTSFCFELPQGPTPVIRGRAQGRKTGRGRVDLLKGNDFSKDQSYFLWTLEQEQISRILFPVGHLNKTEVRKLAKKFKLPVAEKKDSQGICFLGAVDLKDFLKHYIKEKRGKVLNKNGEEIGYHNGVMFLTLGERHGFVVFKKSPKEKPYYVISKDIKNNTITVSENRNCNKTKEEKFYINIEKTNWISEIPKKDKRYTMQIRYHGELFNCKIEVYKNRKARIYTDVYVLADKGQSLVVYNDVVIVGGGIIY